MTTQPHPTDKLRTAILKTATVRRAKVTVSQKMFSNNTVSPPEMSNQEIVEIGIDDLMQVLRAHNKALVEDVIGEDESIQHFSFHGRSDIRDELRKEQRQRAAKWLGLWDTDVPDKEGKQ